MATERSTQETWSNHPDQKAYDLAYYNLIIPMVSGTVIDVGCGKCMLSKAIAEKPQTKSVHAIDRFPVEGREQHYKIKHYVTDLNSGIPMLDDLEADWVVSTEFIEHIPKESLPLVLKGINKHISSNGIFVGTTPNNLEAKGKTPRNPFHIYEYQLGELQEIFGYYFADVEVKDIGRQCAFWVCKTPKLLS